MVEGLLENCIHAFGSLSRVNSVTNTDSSAWKARWMASIKTRILRYRKKRVREVGGYIGGRCTKVWHSSILHVTAHVTRIGAPQAMRQWATSHSRDKLLS
jgi:hypothetical protein